MADLTFPQGLPFAFNSNPAIAVSAVVQPATASVQITVSNIQQYGSLTLYRYNPADNSYTVVRGAFQYTVAGAPSLVFNDYECPLGTSVQYEVVTGDGFTGWSAAVSISVSGSTYWLKSITTPSLNLTVNVSDMGDVVRKAKTLAQYDVLNRQNPIIITDVRGGRTGTMKLAVDGAQEIKDLLAIFKDDSIGTLLFQAPAQYNFPDMYFNPGDLAESWLTTAGGLIHIFSFPFTEVDQPNVSAFVSAANTWLQVSQFGTWQDVLDKRATWLDVLNIPWTTADA